MKVLIIFIFCSISILAIPNEKPDSLKSHVEVSGVVSLNSNGIAPIPYFALGKPALISNISISKNRFSYDPQLAYGFDMRPWIMDNWFHYKLISKPEFELRTGINTSMFFSALDSTGEKIWRGQKYMAFELAAIYKFSQTSSVSLMTWLDRGLEDGTVSGYFINLVGDMSDIAIGKHILMAVSLQTFYINYTGKNDGLFISPKISFSSRNLPIVIYSQGIQPLICNISPFPSFQWNAGIGYSF